MWTAEKEMSWYPKKCVALFADAEHNAVTITGHALAVQPSAQYLGITITAAGLCAERTISIIGKSWSRVEDLQTVRIVGSSLVLKRARHIFETFIRHIYE